MDTHLDISLRSLKSASIFESHGDIFGSVGCNLVSGWLLGCMARIPFHKHERLASLKSKESEYSIYFAGLALEMVFVSCNLV